MYRIRILYWIALRILHWLLYDCSTVRPRQIAVAIPFCQTGKEIQICLVSSRKHDGQFVLPKGGVEKGEEVWQTAVREMWEEGKLLL